MPLADLNFVAHQPDISRNTAARWRGMRVGLLGGSFNPAHRGHRLISLTALKQLKLDAVWWLVSPQNPLKSPLGMAPLAQRLARAREVAAHPAIWPTDIEQRLGCRYSIDTAQALLAQFPQTRFIWLMGADNLAGFHRWHRWRDLAQLLPIAVMLRPGYTTARWAAPAMAPLARARHGQASASTWPTWETPSIVMINLPMDSVSATQLRALDPAWSTWPGTPEAA